MALSDLTDADKKVYEYLKLYDFVEKADLLYNLCVGEALIFFNHKFAINGKRRAGQVMIGGQ